MAQRRNNTLMDPPIEDLLDKVDSKFTLVALSAKRARQINSYYNQLGEGMGMVVPPQVTSVSGKPLTIAFEETNSIDTTPIPPIRRTIRRKSRSVTPAIGASQSGGSIRRGPICTMRGIVTRRPGGGIPLEFSM